MQSFPEQILVRHLQYAKCCSEPRGCMDKWHSVCHKGSQEKQASSHNILRQMLCWGIYKVTRDNKGGRNCSAFWESGWGLREDSRQGVIFERDLKDKPHNSHTSVAYFNELAGHFTTLFLRFLINQPRELRVSHVFKTCVEKSLPPKHGMSGRGLQRSEGGGWG